MIKFSYKRENNKTEVDVIIKSETIISVLFSSSTLIQLLKHFFLNVWNKKAVDINIYGFFYFTRLLNIYSSVAL